MSFSLDTIEQVWSKGKIIPGNDPRFWRQDQCGAWIGRKFYGNRNSQYGWEIDHITPGDDDNISNLRPLQWSNNAERQDGRLSCPVTSNGINNTR